MLLKVAVLQYEVPEDTQKSLLRLDEMVGQASWAGAKLVVAPETSIGPFSEVKAPDKDCLPELKSIAKKHRTSVATSFYSKDKGKYYNQGYIVSDLGDVVHSYRKIYLAPPERDNDEISGGSGLTVSKTDLGNVGMLICKDGFNKFSHEMYSKLNELGADIICAPTWSRASKELDTQEYIKSHFVYGAFTSRSFVLVSGNLNKVTGSFGRSLIISPIKGVLKEGSADKKEILFEELDLTEVAKAREFDTWWQPKEKVTV